MEKMRFVRVKKVGDAVVALLNLNEVMLLVPEVSVVKDFHGRVYTLVERDDVDTPFMPRIQDCIVEI